MKLLFLTPYLPDEHAGAAGPQLMWRVITGLAKVHQIILISYTNPEDDPTPLLQEGIRLYMIPFPRHYGHWNTVPVKMLFRRGLKLLISILCFRPYELEKYRSRVMKRLVAKVISEETLDLVQCEYNLMALNLPKVVIIPKVLVEHDVSMKPYARLKTFAHSRMLRIIGGFQSWLWGHTEPKLCNQFNLVITLTPEDKNWLQSRGVHVPIQVIPPPVNVRTDIQFSKNADICFVGAFNRRPNREALEEILVDIWPMIKDAHPTCRLMIAGRHLAGELLARVQSDDRIKFAGFVTDIDSFIASCSILLAPIRLGGGLKMKITHALACGTPVVTTTIGAEGIDLNPDEGLIIEDDPLKMARVALDILRSPDRIQKLSIAAAQAVQNKFSLTAALEKYQQLYRRLI